MKPFQPSPALADAVARAARRRPVFWGTRSNCGGYTNALRLFVRFADGAAAFVKAAADANTKSWIEREQSVYERLNGQPYLPRYFGGAANGGEEDGAPFEMTFLLLEDLSDALWPPPWSEARVNAVRKSLEAVRAAAPFMPPDLPRLADEMANSPGWRQIAEDPAAFLSLGICSPEWLENALPALLEAAAAAPAEGSDLVHLDVRSDNICFRANGTAVLIDWNWVHIGNGAFDLACWAPSLHAEGGPVPETLAPDAPEFAAWLAGYFGQAAGRPPPSGAQPRVRELQKQQLAVALPWAVRALRLPPLDGPASASLRF